MARVSGGFADRNGATPQASFATAGVQAGYNVLSGALLAGIEANFQPASNRFRGAGNLKLQTNYGYGALRAQLGFAAERFRLYGFAGLAVTSVEVSGRITSGQARQLGVMRANGGSISIKRSKLLTELVLGGGAAYALSENWGIRAEAACVRLEGQRIPVPTRAARQGDIKAMMFTAGLNYYF